MEKIENYKNYFNIKIIIVGEGKVYKNKINIIIYIIIIFSI